MKKIFKDLEVGDKFIVLPDNNTMCVVDNFAVFVKIRPVKDGVIKRNAITIKDGSQFTLSQNDPVIKLSI